LTEDNQENEGASKNSGEGLVGNFVNKVRSAPKAVQYHRTPRRFATGDDYRASRERFGVRRCSGAFAFNRTTKKNDDSSKGSDAVQKKLRCLLFDLSNELSVYS
jgi:hypothetical protein